MRILFVQRHFWPDVPTYAHLTKDIAIQLAADGHDVSVFSTTPSYNAAYDGPPPPLRETVGGVTVHRVEMQSERSRRTRHRLADTGRFLAHVSSYLLRHRRDYDVVVTTNAPAMFLPATVRLLTRLTRKRYVYHCQDLQPEAAVIAGVASDTATTRLLRRLDHRSCKDATAVVVLSQDMRDSLLGRGLSDRNVHVINNFTVEPVDAAPETSSPLSRPNGTYQVVFAGNMGRFQGLDRVVKAARLLADKSDIRFVFMGSGVETDELKRQAGPMAGKSVVFVPHQPLPQAMALLKKSQLGLVPLVPGMYRVAYPSKVMAYLEAGCRLLLLMECASETARTADELDLGTCCESSDARVIADAILAEYERHQERGSDRDQIRSAGRATFSKENVLPEWSRLFTDIEKQINSTETGAKHSEPPSSVSVRHVSSADINDVVAVHMTAFPRSTMTRLGPRFLRKYYETVLAYPHHVFLVADGNRQIFGFVAGFRDPAAFYTMFRQRRIALGLAALPQLLKHPRLVLDIRGGAQWSSDQAESDEVRMCELSSIAVDSAASGMGIGSALVNEFVASCNSMAATGVALTTDADADNRARVFYERLGFHVRRTFKRGSSRQMVEYHRYLDDHDD